MSHLDFLLWFNRGHWGENTSMDIVWYMVLGFVQWSQVGDLDAHANLVFKLIACHQHQRKLLQCLKMCLQDLQFL